MRIAICHRPQSLIVAATTAVLLVHALTATAETIVNQTTSGTQAATAAASSGDQLVAVWLTRTSEGQPAEVRGRRLGPLGGPRGDEFVVSSHGCAIAPDVAVAGDGSFVVAFVECRPEEPGRHLTAQRFDRWAQPLGGPISVGRFDTRSLRVALRGDGSFAIAFSLQPVDSEQTLQLVRFDGDGRPAGVTAVDAEPASLYHAALVVDGLALADDATAVILWHGQRAAESWVAVDAVDAEGFTRRWNLAECVHGEHPGACEDAALGTWGSELLAVWVESQVATEYSIAAQRVAATGEPLGAPWTVVDGRADERIRNDLDVGRADTGGPFVVWSERRDATSPASSVVGRPIGPDWPGGANLTVAPGPGSRAPRVAAQTGDGVVVVWLSGEGYDTDIAARRLEPVQPLSPAGTVEPTAD